MWLWRTDVRRPFFIKTGIFRGKGRWTRFSRELIESHFHGSRVGMRMRGRTKADKGRTEEGVAETDEVQRTADKGRSAGLLAD